MSVIQQEKLCWPKVPLTLKCSLLAATLKITLTNDKCQIQKLWKCMTSLCAPIYLEASAKQCDSCMIFIQDCVHNSPHALFKVVHGIAP